MDKLEYLEFEKNSLIMDAASKKINRIKYGINEDDLRQFYGEVYTQPPVIEEISYRRDIKKAYSIKKDETYQQAQLFGKIFDTDRECFVRIRCAATNKSYSYNVKDLKDHNKLFNILNSKKFTREDLFYSMATYKTMKSGEEVNIFSMHCIPVDIDYKKIRRLKNKTPMEVFEILEKEEFERTIPTPNVCEVGNQLRLLYKFESVGATKVSMNLVKRMGKIFAERLIDYGGDSPRLTDYARIEGSINTKTGDKVHVFFIEDAPIYKVGELRDKWLDVLPEWYPAWKEKSNKVVRFIPKDRDIWFNINTERIQDFFNIAEYYGKEFDGRRFLCFQVRNHAKLRGDSDKEALELMKEFNNSLARPLRIRVIERDTRNVNRKQYQYKNQTVLDYLCIDDKEALKIGLQSIIPENIAKENKKEADRERWKSLMRNDEGVTKTEVRRRNEFIQIAQLELEGLSLRQIAEEIGKNVSVLSRKIHKVYDKFNYAEIKRDVINGIYNEKSVISIV